MRRLFFILFFALFFSPKAQMLFYQDTYKGGVTGDGVSYLNMDYLQADTIPLVNTIPLSSTIKKAFLFSERGIYQVGLIPAKDNSVIVKFNSQEIVIDSNSITGPKFNCDYSPISGENWMTVNDVTPYVQHGVNVLTTPCQGCQMTNDTSRHYVVGSYFLLILYEDLSFPATTASIWLNNKSYFNPMSYTFNVNPINNSNDVGLSIWTNNVRSFPTFYTSDYTVNSGSGNFPLGTLNMYSGNNVWNKKLPGSFDYRNNTLIGLQDDTPDAFIDSTDALANIKTYLPNNATTFSITTSGNVSPGGANIRLGFFLTYTSPCTATTSKDTSIAICRGQSINLNASPGFTNYNWYPLSGLTDSTIANPIATPQHSTNYITYVKDASGCMHTEHTQIVVHGSPVPDSIHITNAICGSSLGSLLIDPNYHNYQPYTYNIGSGNSTDTSFTNLTPGNYTLTVTDNAGCSYQTPFSIAEINPVHAGFNSLSGTNHTAPLLVAFDNISTGANTYNWYFPTDTLHTTDPVYTFADSGTYVVTLIAYNNLPQCSDTATAIFIVLPQDTSGIFIPNVFSPNGDEKNDVFQIRMTNGGLEHFEVFDRWGLLIYQKEKTTFSKEQTVEWDGRTTAGMACSEGTYFYVISYTVLNKANQKEERKAQGFITLVR